MSDSSKSKVQEQEMSNLSNRASHHVSFGDDQTQQRQTNVKTDEQPSGSRQGLFKTLINKLLKIIDFLNFSSLYLK